MVLGAGGEFSAVWGPDQGGGEGVVVFEALDGLALGDVPDVDVAVCGGGGEFSAVWGPGDAGYIFLVAVENAFEGQAREGGLADVDAVGGVGVVVGEVGEEAL